MALKEIQEEVDKWMSKNAHGYFKPLEILTRLVEENGELARELNHRFGPKKKKASEKTKEVGDEISDIIFTLSCLANSLKIDLDKSFTKMMNKLKTRDKGRWGKAKIRSYSKRQSSNSESPRR